MSTLFLRLYVATKVHMTTRPEDGFVTAEHLAIAVAGVAIVSVVAVVFQKAIVNDVIDPLIKSVTGAGNG